MFDFFCKIVCLRYAKGLLGCYIYLVIRKGIVSLIFSDIHKSPGIYADHVFWDLGVRLRQLARIYGFYDEERHCFWHSVTVDTSFPLVIHLCSFLPQL